MIITPFAASHDSAVDTLLDTCFGPARGRRTAALLRHGAKRRDDLSFVAHVDGALAGAIQLWPLNLVGEGRHHRILLLGPLVSAPAHRNRGIGGALMDTALAAADATGERAILLIGDAPYYARWGFSAARTAHWSLPGPVDRARLLLRAPDLPPLPRIAALAPAVSPRARAA
ncbi:GNAT family N-acetyltransferase [Sandaracinobacteroides saxicola]|uniref:N-acetyltransferase n=1 Tax=Sandaracinobacteroides saxicola TaxID=2759707 RepID=A0A7G5IDN4_9SPHN|nr:N-acetyltransferase [Sandaracinobacteroides saxicola]QMW21476.1 N-acetyltransferase [Sandaracinobacteroides saxicola]